MKDLQMGWTYKEMNPGAVHTKKKVIICSWFPILKHGRYVPGRRVFKKKGRAGWEKYLPS